MARIQKEVFIHNKAYVFCAFEGNVVEASRQRETLVSGYGGGGATYDGTGATAPINISSTTIVHDEFFLLDEHGEEEHFHLQNWTMPTRTGHHLQMMWIIPPKKTRGPYVVMNNKNLRQVEWANGQIIDMAKDHYRYIKWSGLALAIVFGVMFKSFWLLVIVAVGSYIFYRKKAGEVEHEMREQLEDLCI